MLDLKLALVKNGYMDMNVNKKVAFQNYSGGLKPRVFRVWVSEQSQFLALTLNQFLEATRPCYLLGCTVLIYLWFLDLSTSSESLLLYWKT